MRTTSEIEFDLEQLSKLAGQRRMRSDMSIRGLRPADSDWLTEEEVDRLSGLHSEWASVQPTLEVVQGRVAMKRAARMVQMFGADACEAEEKFSLDELEEHARKMRERE